MIIEPSLSISTPLSLSFSLSCFRRERGSKVRFLRGRIIPIGNQNQKLLFSLSASFEAKKFPRSVNKIADKKGRNFFVSTLSLSLSVCFVKKETGGSLFQSRKISRGKWEIFSTRHDLLHQRIERWRDSYITRPVRVTPFDVKAPLRIITPPRATLSLFFLWTGVENSVQRIQSGESLSKDELFPLPLSTCTDEKETD